MSTDNNGTINGYELELFFKRIIDKKKICETKKLKDGEWVRKDTFRCRNVWYEDNTNQFIIVRLEFTRRLILTDWEAKFDKETRTLQVRKGSQMVTCELDAADVKWVEMRQH